VSVADRALATASSSPRTEVQDQPEHSKTNASERRKKERAIDPQHKGVEWASGTCLGCPCRTPDRSYAERPETAPADHPPTRCANCGSEIVPALPWVGVLEKRIDIRTIQVSINDGTGPSRSVEPVSRAAF